MLKEIKKLLTVKSALYRSVLDTLHADGIEIMSPVIQNQRRLSEDTFFIPEPRKAVNVKTSTDEGKAEEIVFDKAEEAERIEKEKNDLEQQIEDLEEALKTADESARDTLRSELESCRTKHKDLDRDKDEE